MNDVYIKLPGQLLIMTEAELFKCLALRPEVYKLAVGRGKGYKRAQSVAARNAEGFDRWQLYETLKGNRVVDKDTLAWIEGMNVHEMREGLSEYLTAKKPVR